MLFDTDILIWLFRGKAEAAKFVEDAAARTLSIVSYMELLQGARNRAEMKLIKSYLADYGFVLLPLTENIGHRAAIYMEEYCLKSGLTLADALIAATAVENHAILCTANQKDYRSIKDLEIKVFHP